MNFARFLIPLALALGLTACLVLPATDWLFRNWSQADTEMRSRLIHSTIADDLPSLLAAGNARELTRRFTQLAKEERVLGIAYCQAPGRPEYASKDFPADLSCPLAADPDETEAQLRRIKGGLILLASFPTAPAPGTDEKAGHLLIVQDMSYAERRSERTQGYLLWFTLGIGVISAVITLMVARITLNRWVLGLHDFVQGGRRAGRLPKGLPRQAMDLTMEIQQRIREIEREHQHLPRSGGQWSAATLAEFIKGHLPSEQLIAVSYRQPYAHSQTAQGLQWSTPASGLVTAVEPIMRACQGTWIAAAGSEADRLAADASGVVMVPPDRPAYRLKRLWFSEEEEAGFYVGFANEGLWPLCNIAYVKPRFRASDWESYKVVNRKFADAIAAEATSSAPVIFIHDYHFGLLPKLIRERLPDALIILFWHIPWPNSETFGILPWRQEFLELMLAADIIGFHTQAHCNNFLDCVDSYVEALVDREHDGVRRGEDLCMIRPYPISIAWPEAEAETPEPGADRRWLAAMLAIDPATKIAVGVERLDYIKGIPERLRAFGIMLDGNPHLHGKVAFVQVASPSRSIIPAYARIEREVEHIAEGINRTHGDGGVGGWKPVHVLRRNFGQRDVYRFYRAADACIVSSLHDGMNLVAKEFVAARDDERGALVLSEFAGSSRELVDALIVNPYDEEGLAQGILRALTMSEAEQQARMRSMRAHVRAHNVYGWAAAILEDATNLHRRRQLNSMLVRMKSAAGEGEGENAIIPWPLKRFRPLS